MKSYRNCSSGRCKDNEHLRLTLSHAHKPEHFYKTDHNMFPTVSCFCEITANFFRAKEKSCHILGDTETPPM